MVFADFHIHIGQSLNGKPVKITASRNLTLPNVIKSARDVKGLSIAGVVDAHSTGVRADFRLLLDEGLLTPLSGGGYRAGNLVILPGTEIELALGTGTAHLLAFFPAIEHVEKYVRAIAPAVRNWQLSSQKAFLAVEDWLAAVQNSDGFWLPAHAFTPHKGIYGNCCRRLTEVLPVLPVALEIGLSADSAMAHRIKELDGVRLLSNSDAHSLPNIAREYNALALAEVTFAGVKELVAGKSGKITANYGLPPQVGKYHRTYCLVCEAIVTADPPVLSCPRCQSGHVIPGVLDRVVQIADRPGWEQPDPGYIYQVSLLHLPGIGPKMYGKLLAAFGTEMTVLNEAPVEDLLAVAGERIAGWVLKARTGRLEFTTGGGGIFGRVVDILPADS